MDTWTLKKCESRLVSTRPGEWAPARTEDGKDTVDITCPECGRIGSLGCHKISREGEVNPSVLCPFYCDFHAMIRLEKWW